jgi:hypothetical protein
MRCPCFFKVLVYSLVDAPCLSSKVEKATRLARKSTLPLGVSFGIPALSSNLSSVRAVVDQP